MDEPYRVEVLHIVNPHLIFVESQTEEGTPVIQQVGIFGVLPVYKTVDIDGKIIAERCENWPIAANTILREIFAEYKSYVYFVPIHVDERSTIFDDDVHQFGDFIIQHGRRKSIIDYLTELVVAVKDESTFHQRLISGSLKLKMNTERTEEVLNAIKKYYNKQRKVGHDWQKTIEKQTSIHKESMIITALTKENLKLLENNANVYDVKHIMMTIEQKEKDLKLCKDADLESIGRGSRCKTYNLETSKHTHPDYDYAPQQIFSHLKDFLLKNAKKKEQNDRQLICNKIIKHSTPKQEFKKHTNMETYKSLDSDGEWDYNEVAQITHTKEIKNEQMHQKEVNSDHEKHNQNLGQKQETSQMQHFYNTDEQKESQQYNNKEEQFEMEKPTTKDIPSNDRKKIGLESYKNKTKLGSQKDVMREDLKQKTNRDEFDYKGIRHSGRYLSTSMKPRERHLVFCPDMEMNTTNLKNLVTITVPEDSATNFANVIQEVQDKKNILDNDNNFDIHKSIDKDIPDDSCKNDREIGSTSYENETNFKKTKLTSESISKVNEKSVSKLGLNTSLLEKKMLALQKSQNENNSISSNSDVGNNQRSTIFNSSVNTKSFENAFDMETTVSNKETRNIRNSSSKANRTLSISILQKKLQALKELKIRKRSSSSTSDTSVKDTGSSTEQSKIDLDEVDQVKHQLEPAKLEIQLKLAENVNRNVNPFKNLDGSKSVFVEKLVSPILMVHTKNNNLIIPQCEIRDVPFKPDIQMMLKSMRIQKPKRLQMVTWGYILRGHSMFIIGPAGNGKTVGYVPAVCNLLLDSSMKLEGVGPICIIVCATALSVLEVESYCKRFLSVEERIVTFFPGLDATKTTTDLLNGCHVLICTAPALLTLLETDFGVDLRRLCTLVLDDCERLSQVYIREVYRIIQHVKAMLKNRADKALKVQYVVASRQWCDFMRPLAKTAPDTVIAIGASQECVLYSKTKTSVAIVKGQENKINAVVEFLAGIDRTKRTVIVCREDEEVVLLENTLQSQKHVVFSCNSTMDLHELCRLNEVWASYEEPILGPILICCDGNLTHLNITDANYLVHFSMPVLFSMFCKRFSVLNENYASIFGPEREDVKIKILLDETNVEQLPKILHFVKRCTKETFPNLENILQEVLIAKDLKKAENLNPICNNLLMLGECPDMWNCSDRHTAFKEYDEPKDWIPKKGIITFKITHYDSAVTYSARVLSKITKSGPVKYPNNYNTLSLKMGMYYSKEINQKLHGVPKIGDLCAVARKQNFYERCQVLKVIPTGTKNTNQVLINLIDEEQLTIVSDVLLYYLPDDFKTIETHVVKVRLANIQPKDRDVTFSLAAQEHLKQITDHEREHGLYIRGRVVMTLGNTIFVDTAEACVDLSSLGETVMKRDYKKELLSCHAEPNPQHIQKLHELKKVSGLDITIDVIEPNIPNKLKKCPKWAHLDKDEFSTVIFSAVIDAGTIFLRLEKFKKVVESLLKDIKECVEKAPKIDQEEIYVGNFVLAEFPDDGTYERARIDEVVSDQMANCFFVDNGDWRQVAVNKLKPMTDYIMHRIPFQAIECRLVGVKPPGNTDAWPEFSTCWLDENCFEDKDCNQKLLFAKYFTKETATVTGGHKYGVVLIDTTSEEDVTVNKAMIELNLAKTIEDEEKYIEEPLNIKRVISDSSSDITDEVIAVNNNSIMDNETQVTKDVVPIQPKENENTPTNNIPLQILFGKPIRSMPLVNSDSESDISDKWDVNVDKDLLGMFGQPSKTNISECKDIKDEGIVDTLGHSTNENQITPDKEQILDKSYKVCETKNENFIKSRTNGVVCSNVKPDNGSQESLDSDDIDVTDKRVNTLKVFRSKISKKNLKEKLMNTSINKIIEKKKNDTLDSDDLSEITETSIAKMNADAIDPPRKPKIIWRQNKHTIAMKINLIGVKEYTLEIKERYIKFKTWHSDTNYEFELDLYGVIVSEKCTHSNKGQYILVRLLKMLPRNWLNLTKDFSPKKWISHDVDAIDFSSDEEEDDNMEARKVLKHNHENADSSSDDENFLDDTSLKYKSH